MPTAGAKTLSAPLRHLTIVRATLDHAVLHSEACGVDERVRVLPDDTRQQDRYAYGKLAAP